MADSQSGEGASKLSADDKLSGTEIGSELSQISLDDGDGELNFSLRLETGELGFSLKLEMGSGVSETSM